MFARSLLTTQEHSTCFAKSISASQGRAPRQSRQNCRALLLLFGVRTGVDCRVAHVVFEAWGLRSSLLHAGDQDRWTPANGTVAGFFRKKAVDAPQQYVFADVKDCGHVPFDDRPDEVASELTRWLDRRIMPSCQ